MSRACRIIVVPEDRDHAALARGYFHERGVHPRAYQVTSKWSGKNGNFDRVRQWFAEEVKLQAKELVRFGVIALIDEDGKGLAVRRESVTEELARLGLPGLDPSKGRLLVIPVRNVETWMVWGARWTGAGRPASPGSPAGFSEVDETHDYKRWETRDGQPLPREKPLDGYQLGRAIGTLNPAAPPGGLPPALEAILRPWSDFMDWARRRSQPA
jgi:hypothetical protein